MSIILLSVKIFKAYVIVLNKFQLTFSLEFIFH